MKKNSVLKQFKDSLLGVLPYLNFCIVIYEENINTISSIY